MSFFGFEQKDLEKEKLGGRLRETEDLHVYALHEEGYDGLGDSLHEGGDELNDETFGGTGVVGAPDMLFAMMAIYSSLFRP
jgi:DNA topoisomerase 2-associated protein PAT1